MKVVIAFACFFLSIAQGMAQDRAALRIEQLDRHAIGIVSTPRASSQSLGVNSLEVFVLGHEVPVLGKTNRVGPNKLSFVPDFPLEEGVRYLLVYAGRDTIVSLPASSRSVARVESIFPTTDRIPENLLRFYIYFSAPMREGDFLSHIHLYDENGVDLKGVFFDNQYELWNEDFTRLTILVDPGRVKTGLTANREFGRAFQKGQRYRLVIDKGWKTIQGQPLEADFVKAFRATPADLTAPDQNNWAISLPKTNSLDPLVIHFGESVDHRSVHQFIRIVDQDQVPIAGEMRLQQQESTLQFFPTEKWTSDDFQLLINSRFEDIVGNNLNGLFDHPIGSLKSEQEGLVQSLTFER